MTCATCGTDSADEFRFCPQCGKELESKPLLSHSCSSSPEVPSPTSTSEIEPPGAQQEPEVKKIKPGTVVFGAFSVITCIAAIGKGLPPVYILEAAGWAGAAWYWQRKRSHSELARFGIILLALLVAIGEVTHISIEAGSKTTSPKPSGGNPFDSLDSPRASTAADSGDPFAKYRVQDMSSRAKTHEGAPTDSISRCPANLPAGIRSQSLPANKLFKVVGTSAKLSFEQAPFPDPDNVIVWNANLGFDNKTDSCISMVVVELELGHGGILSKERHGVTFQPLLGPGQVTDGYVSLKIRTTNRGDDVALLGWRTISASGFKP